MIVARHVPDFVPVLFDEGKLIVSSFPGIDKNRLTVIEINAAADIVVIVPLVVIAAFHCKISFSGAHETKLGLGIPREVGRFEFLLRFR